MHKFFFYFEDVNLTQLILLIVNFVMKNNKNLGKIIKILPTWDIFEQDIRALRQKILKYEFLIAHREDVIGLKITLFSL